MKQKIYFRADGHAKMGLGHVIRSLALIGMLKETFDCHFIIQNPLPTLKEQILLECQSIIELPPTEEGEIEATRIVKTYLTGNEIVVLDGYHFNTVYQRIIKNKGSKVVCIDDIHQHHFIADIVINHAPNLNHTLYSTEAYTKKCFGLNYSLLRKPFLDAAKQEREFKKIEQVFICFGGSDFNNITLKVIKGIVESKYAQFFKKIHIVIGSANLNHETLKPYVEQYNLNVYKNLSALEMATLMKKCQLAIVPASSILYEILAIRMPVISGFYVNNQENIYHGFKKMKLIFGIGDFNVFDDYESTLDAILNENLQEILLRQKQELKGDAPNNFLRIFKNLTNGYSDISR